MTFLHRIAHVSTAVVQGIVRGLTRGFDALVGPVGRLSDRIEAHLLDRTRLLRAHYATSVDRVGVHDRFGGDAPRERMPSGEAPRMQGRPGFP